MDAMKLPLLLGSVRIGRRSEDVARYLLSRLAKDHRFRPELLDIASYRFPLLEERPSEMSAPPEGVEHFSRQLREADALLIVSPEYKGGIPGALKNALDLLEPKILHRKPVGICTVSAGGFGGVQCLGQLRHIVLALGGVPIPESISISRVQDVFDREGMLQPGAKPIEIESFLTELSFYAEALKRERMRPSPDVFGGVGHPSLMP